MVTLRCGRIAFAVPRALVEAARPRCDVGAWTDLPGVPAFSIELGVCPPGMPLDDTDPSLGGFEQRLDATRVWTSSDPRAAEAALKVGFARAALMQGGLLVHSSALWFPEVGAVVAVGPSGAGKSTLAKLGTQAGAALLSDETNVLLPSGEVCGTPFRSDTTLEPSPRCAAVRSLIALQKGPSESLSPLQPHRAVALVMAQQYRLRLPNEDPRAQLSRVAELVQALPAATFTFRKHPDAIASLRHELERS